MTHQKQLIKYNGFTLTELLAGVAIIGIISSIALPNYLNQVNRSRQNEVASRISQMQTTIASYADEFGVLPTSWSDLNSISAVMTEDGPATATDFGIITLADGFYEAEISTSGNLFTITATNKNEPTLNIEACLNLTNGASGIYKNNESESAKKPCCETDGCETAEEGTNADTGET